MWLLINNIHEKQLQQQILTACAFLVHSTDWPKQTTTFVKFKRFQDQRFHKRPFQGGGGGPMSPVWILKRLVSVFVNACRLLSEEVVSCRDFILRAVATFWAILPWQGLSKGFSLELGNVQGLILCNHQPVKDNSVYLNQQKVSVFKFNLDYESSAFTRSVCKKCTAVLKSGERFK